MNSSGCPFCLEFEQGLQVLYPDIGVASRTLARTDNFVVLADISPLRPGHCLILPHRHLVSFGQIKDGQERQELERLLSSVIAVISERFEPPTVMEHGSTTNMDGGACIAHAHLQVVPGAYDTRSALASYNVTSVDAMWDVERWSDRDEPYIFVSDSEGMKVADGISGIERQFIRRMVAEQSGLPEPLWNWRALVLADNLERTVRGLGDLQESSS